MLGGLLGKLFGSRASDGPQSADAPAPHTAPDSVAPVLGAPAVLGPADDAARAPKRSRDSAADGEGRAAAHHHLVPQISASALAADPAAVEEVYRRHWRDGLHNLAPGLPYWGPPAECAAVLARFAEPAAFADRQLHRYGDVRGEPRLLEAIARKLRAENGLALDGLALMVTAGANQAYVNALMATCAPGDAALIYAPYYFTHVVAMQLLGVRPVIVPCDPTTLLPDPAAIGAAAAAERGALKAVVITSPGNPSGAVVPAATLEALVAASAAAGLWLISDEAYEHFTFDGAAHHSPAGGARPSAAGGAHVLSLFTLSKSYGMAGWRVGYMAYPAQLDEVMLKIQDTVPTHASALAQAVAAAALDAGAPWVRARVRSLEPMRAAVWAAADATVGRLPGARSVRGAGALYAFVRLPAGVDDDEAVRILADEHAVLVLPGSSAGAPGHLRVSFASVPHASAAADAALAALRRGLEDIAARAEARAAAGAR